MNFKRLITVLGGRFFFVATLASLLIYGVLEVTTKLTHVESARRVVRLAETLNL